jgi:osmoprotectant transport system permease protein
MRNRVLLALALLLLAAGLGLPFLTHAPNRLITGHGIALPSLLHGTRWLAVAPFAVLAAAPFAQQTRWLHVMVAAAAAALLLGLAWLAGNEALRLAAAGSPLGRTSFGGGFWMLLVLSWLAASDALGRTGWPTIWRGLASAAVLLPLLALLGSGALDQLSVLKEYADRQDVFDDALGRHLTIVGATLLPTVLLGLPLGVAAFRQRAFGGPLFAVLNVIQTIPSIALFGLLMAPLAALAAHATWLADWGISGIGMAPAVIALVLYSLLPTVRSTVAGLEQVPGAVVEAARGMGLTPAQIFWRVELPLALPVWLSGLRITAVQAVGLTVVAALIGAGGFGAIVFQGLLSSALDLVLLGVIPVIALAVACDALFKLAVTLLESARP